MKKLILFSFIGLMFGSLCKAQNFEGIINLTVQNIEKNEIAQIIWKMQNGNHRMEFKGSAKDKNYSYTLLILKNETKAKLLTEANGQKIVYTVGIPSSTNDNVKYFDHAFPSSNRMIAGYHAEQITLKAVDRRTIAWISKDLPFSLDDLPPTLKANGVLNYFLLRNISGIPVELESIDATGKVLFSQKITSIQKIKISESEFIVGSEYQDPANVLKAEPIKTE